jgi:asparagine synthase (glutamine-hydrolysing)
VTHAPVREPHVEAPRAFEGQRVLGLGWDDRGQLVSHGPWPARRGPLQAFFHGRLTNKTPLCAELGLRPADVSDDDVVLAAYALWKDAGLEKLRGIFAAAVIDGDRNQALIARDQLGCHPLFYASLAGGRTLLLGADPRDLLRQPGVPATLNRPALADHLCRRWPDRGETFFEAIRRVRPGFRLRVSRAGLSAERYWDPVPEEGPIEWVQGDIPELFDHVFNQAVDRCLHSGPSGIFLSGGFDSISVAAVAVDRARTAGLPTPLALSLEFPHPIESLLVQH